MGICVANLSLRSTGLVLANAYMALSTNRLAVMPQGNLIFTVQSSYSMWADYDARIANCSPLDSRLLMFTWNSPQNDPVSMYAAAYRALKIEYPNCTDSI